MERTKSVIKRPHSLHLKTVNFLKKWTFLRYVHPIDLKPLNTCFKEKFIIIYWESLKSNNIKNVSQNVSIQDRLPEFMSMIFFFLYDFKEMMWSDDQMDTKSSDFTRLLAGLGVLQENYIMKK